MIGYEGQNSGSGPRINAEPSGTVCPYLIDTTRTLAGCASEWFRVAKIVGAAFPVQG